DRRVTPAVQNLAGMKVDNCGHDKAPSEEKYWPWPYRDDRLVAIHCAAFIAAFPLDFKANDPIVHIGEPQTERFLLVRVGKRQMKKEN
ncbi:MAG: hypothetical protein KBT59_04605, partial [Sphingomonadales bacterium]|nr:hypothetical protein [Sphingomonadales bacterium]